MLKRFILLWVLLPVISVKAQEVTPTSSPPDFVIAFDHGGDLYTTNFEGEPINLTNSETHEVMPVWSPDGSKIAFLSAENYEDWDEYHLYVLTLETGEIRQVSDLTLTTEAMLAWSPDGRLIAVTHAALFRVELESGDTQQFTTDDSASYPSWTADSSQIVYELDGEIYVIDSDGGNLQQLTTAHPYTWRPALSPVSDEIVFISDPDEAAGIYTIRLSDPTFTMLVELSDYSTYNAYWSPDGQHLAFEVFARTDSNINIPGMVDVYVVNRDGSDIHTATGDQRDSFVAWVDAEHLLYWAGEPGGAFGAFYAVNIEDGTQTHLSNETLESMCSYNNCHYVSIRP
jgi:Tol biopolymer transport system component